MQLVNILKGVQEGEDGSKVLSGKLDAILAELRVIHDDVDEIKAHMKQTSSFMSNIPPQGQMDIASCLRFQPVISPTKETPKDDSKKTPSYVDRSGSSFYSFFS